MPASATGHRRTLGAYRMPAEWARHESTWLTWPKNRLTWPGRMLSETENIYLQMIRALLAGERVNLIVPDEKTAKSVASRVGAKGAALSRLIFHRAKTVDAWIRDYGPIFVNNNSGKAFIKFIFNAWGGKYGDLAQDNAVVNCLSALSVHRRFDVPVVLEGGSIDMDGQGTCLTTEQCLLNPNRNPTLSRGDLEMILRGVLGAERVIWLKDGIEADDTDGHVDDITRFVAPATVVTAVEPDREDRINHRALSENLSILRSSRDAAGRRLKIIELPMPGRVGTGRRDPSTSLGTGTGHTRSLDCAQDRLPASYANFYISNAAVLLPVYSHRNDRAAVRILRKVFPTRKIVPIECTALVYGLGSIHCVTQQEPA